MKKQPNIKKYMETKMEIYWLNIHCHSYTGDTAGLENANNIITLT